MATCPFCRSEIIDGRYRFDDLDDPDLFDDEDDGDHEDDDWYDDGGPLEITVPADAEVDVAALERAIGRRVVVHRDDLPACDVTEVRGIRCTTPIRTCIDMAPRLTEAELTQMLSDFLGRGLMTPDEAWNRLGQPDLAVHHGAELVRRALRPLG